MKKMITAIAVMGLMAVSAFGLDGKIGAINFASNGKVWVTIIPVDTSAAPVSKQLSATDADIKKAMTAAVLTAKSTNADVTVYADSIGWKNIKLK